MSKRKINPNLPNQLTVMRIFCVPVFLFFLLCEGIPLNILWAGIVFALAMITDLLDGRIARKYDLVSDFGKFWDPLADKLMTLTALIGISSIKETALPTVIACCVLWRELLVTGLRLTAAGKSGKVIAANIWGKLKTVFQCVYIGLELLSMFLAQTSLAGRRIYLSVIGPAFGYAALVTGVIMILLTVWSGVTYYLDFRRKA